MRLLLIVGAGSFIGGALRYLISQVFLSKVSGFPYATLLINIAGCFAIGLIYGIASKGTISDDWRLFIATGILGGFTTFSAFSYESIEMLRSGNGGMALSYVGASVIVGLLSTYVGMKLVG